MVGVLKLVYKDVAELQLIPTKDIGMALEELQGKTNEISEIDPTCFKHQPLVGGERYGKLTLLGRFLLFFFGLRAGS